MKRTLLVAVFLFAVLAFSFSMTGNTVKAEPDCASLTIITESFPDFFVGVPVNFQIEASGGTPPYKYKITDGDLPAGLSLTRDGLITGVPTEVIDTTIFVRLKDTGPCGFTQAFVVRVNP